MTVQHQLTATYPFVTCFFPMLSLTFNHQCVIKGEDREIVLILDSLPNTLCNVL